MSEVNIYTYEIYLLDFYEGNLSKRLEDKLRQFILSHPELAIDLKENCIDAVLPAENEIFLKKKCLLKDERADKFADYVIAEMENCISKEEIQAKNELIALYPYLLNEEKYIRKTYLKPNTSIVFSRKNQLVQKSGFGKRIFLYWSGAAASVIVVSMAIFLNRKPQNQPKIAGNSAKNMLHLEENKPFESAKKLSAQNIRIAPSKSSSVQHSSDKTEKKTANDGDTFEVQKLKGQELKDFKTSSAGLQLPTSNYISTNSVSSTTMAMTDQSLDLLSPKEFINKLLLASDTLKQEKKGFTIRIGKLVLLHFKGKDRK